MSAMLFDGGFWFAVWDGRAWGICRDLRDHYAAYFEKTGAGDWLGFMTYEDAAAHCAEWPKGEAHD